ncbi:MAG: hypothetical protein ACRDKZ_07695, partial [Actinomycetota bacterium]
MLEGFLAVPLHFTIELLGFVVCAGAAALLVSRPGLVPGGTFARLAAALGFAVLAAAQVLHGGAFTEAETDGARLLVLIHASGFALLAAALLGSSSSVPAVSVREPLLFVPAGIAGLVAILALGRSRGPGFGALTRLALGALLLGAADALTALAPRATFGLGSVSPYAYAAHGVKLLGFVAVGAWVWTGVRSSIRSRFVATFAALLLVVILALSTSLTAVISDNVGDAQLATVQTQLDAQ